MSTDLGEWIWDMLSGSRRVQVKEEREEGEHRSSRRREGDRREDGERKRDHRDADKERHRDRDDKCALAHTRSPETICCSLCDHTYHMVRLA